MDDFFLFLTDLLDLVASPKAERRRMITIIAGLLAIGVVVGLVVRFYFF